MEDKYLNLLKTLVGDDVKVVSSLHGGMMNESYVVESKQGKFVFYIPTEQASEMVNRYLEKEAQDIASSIGVTRETIYFDLDSGVKLSRYIEGDSLNHLEKFNATKVAETLFKFHSSTQKSSEDYNPLERLKNFKKEASQYVKQFDTSFDKLFNLIEEKSSFLVLQEKCICHNDAQRSNFIIDKNEDYFLIDFEFAMNNDPLYDIATFGNDNVQDGLDVLEAYSKYKQFENSKERYLLWRIDISLQWYLVALIKHYRGEGKTHNIDFLLVAEHFIKNALEAYKIYVAI